MDLDNVVDFLKGNADFKGQLRAEKLTQKVSIYGLCASGIACILLDNFKLLIYGVSATYAAVTLLCFAIPLYRRDPAQWSQPPDAPKIIVQEVE